MKTRVIIADDHQILRDGLRILLESKLGSEVIGEAENGKRAIELVQELQPDIIIMDINMPDINGIDATKEILRDHSDIKVIALSMHADRRFVTQMLKAGASGYLLKDCAFIELQRAIETISTGKIYVSPSIAGVIVSDYLEKLDVEPLPGGSTLSDKERKILQLLAEGRTTKEIAFYFNISVKTVETHRQHIMDKLDIHSIAELTKYAIREGLTSLD